MFSKTNFILFIFFISFQDVQCSSVCSVLSLRIKKAAALRRREHAGRRCAPAALLHVPWLPKALGKSFLDAFGRCFELFPRFEDLAKAWKHQPRLDLLDPLQSCGPCEPSTSPRGVKVARWTKSGSPWDAGENSSKRFKIFKMHGICMLFLVSRAWKWADSSRFLRRSKPRRRLESSLCKALLCC